VLRSSLSDVFKLLHVPVHFSPVLFADLTFVLPKAFSGSPDRLHGVSMTL
jgi:hypothetical protein